MPDVAHGGTGGSRAVFRGGQESGFHCLDHFTEGDLGGASGEDVPASLAPFAGYNVRSLEFVQDLDEKAGGDIFPLGDVLELYHRATIIVPGKADHRPTGILQFLGNPHR